MKWKKLHIGFGLRFTSILQCGLHQNNNVFLLQHWSPRVANWPPKFMDTEYQKDHIGSNFSLDLRIVLLGSSFNLRMYLIHCMQIMEKHKP
jgi:hypothetical protein